MKKFFLPLLAVALIAILSCGDDDPIQPEKVIVVVGGDGTNGGDGGNTGGDTGGDTGGGNGGDTGGDGILPPPGADALSPAEQQKKMQQVGEKAMSYVSALDFKYWSDLCEHVDDAYIDNERFDNDVVEDFFESLVQSTEIAGSHHQDNRQETYNWGETYIYNYIYDYTDYNCLILLSNIRGHFTAGSNGWTKQDANDLQFTFKDQNGSTCIAKLTHSGKTQTVHVMDLEDSDYEWYQNGNTYTSTSYYENNKYYVEIPEQINVTFTVGGTQRMTTDIRLDLNGIENQTIDIEKLSLDAHATVKLDGYEFKTTNIKYQPNSVVSTNFQFIKGGKTIVTVNFKAGDFYTLSLGGDITQEDTWDHIVDFGTVSGGQAQITVDVLGELQINANLSDFGTIRETLEKLEDDDRNESAYKADVQKLNSLMQAGLYYDRTSTLQANFLLKAFEEMDRYYGNVYDEDRYWEIKPIIRFADGSSYSLLEETSFFNETSFKSLIDKATQLFEDFEDLFDY